MLHPKALGGNNMRSFRQLCALPAKQGTQLRICGELTPLVVQGEDEAITEEEEEEKTSAGAPRGLAKPCLLWICRRVEVGVVGTVVPLVALAEAEISEHLPTGETLLESRCSHLLAEDHRVLVAQILGLIR